MEALDVLKALQAKISWAFKNLDVGNLVTCSFAIQHFASEN